MMLQDLIISKQQSLKFSCQVDPCLCMTKELIAIEDWSWNDPGLKLVWE